MPTEREPRNIGVTPANLTFLLDRLRDSENSTAETTYREVSIEDYQFYAGDQDDDDTITELEALNRPISTYNEIKPKIDMLVGMAAQTKHDPIMLPIEATDEALAELSGNVLTFFHKKLKIADKEIDCFDHTCKSGRSLLHFYIDTSNPFKPEIKCMRFPGDKFWLDPDGVELDLSDHKFIFMEKWFTEETVKVFWPEIEISEIEEFGKRARGELSFFNEAKRLYRIIEGWYKKWVKVKYFINPMTGKDEYLEPKEFNQFVAQIQKGITDPETGEVVFQDETGVVGFDSYVEEIHFMIFSANKVLNEGKSPYRYKGYPSVLFGAYKDDDKNNWFSPITMMKDPQRALNTMRRQLVHLLQTLPKGILIHEVGAILDIEEYEKESSDPKYHLEVSKGGLDKVKFEKQPQISSVYQLLDPIFQQSMKDGSGIQDSLMGISEGTREPGITRRMKQETGVAVLYTLFHNFRKSRLQVSRLLFSLIQQYVTAEQVIRIEGPEGAQLMEINSQLNRDAPGFNDISSAEFDITIDETVESATTRLTIAQILTEFSHNNPGSIPPDIILDYADMPYSVKTRVKQFHEEVRKQEQANIDRDFELREMEIGVKDKAASIKKESAERKE